MKTRNQKLNAFLQSEGATSFMNNRRWGIAMHCLADFPLRFRLKLLRQATPSEWNTSIVRDCYWRYIELPNLGPVPMLEVEWFEIDPIRLVTQTPSGIEELQDWAPRVEKTLQNIKVPYSHRKGFIRIWGHYIAEHSESE